MTKIFPDVTSTPLVGSTAFGNSMRMVPNQNFSENLN